MKFTSLFITADAVYIRCFTLYIKTSLKNIITKGTATNNPRRHEKIINHNSYEKLFLFF